MFKNYARKQKNRKNLVNHSWPFNRTSKLHVLIFVLSFAIVGTILLIYTLAATIQRNPLIGANFTHYQIVNCSLSDYGIIRNYNKPGVRAKVQQQLATMRAGGADDMRTILWFMHDPGTNTWGPVPSAGGHLIEPYRTNLINYVTDVRMAGYQRLTLAYDVFGPYSPRNVNYVRSNITEDWNFMRDTRNLVKQNGPADTHFDLLNESTNLAGLSSAYWPKLHDYLVQIWQLYSNEFGQADATYSFIGSDLSSYDQYHWLDNLLTVFRDSGSGYPKWFEIHTGYRGAVAATRGLNQAEQILRQAGLNQPLIIGETAYNDPAVTTAIEQYVNNTGRQVLEVNEWPNKVLTSGCNAMSESPPYSMNALLPLHDFRLK